MHLAFALLLSLASAIAGTTLAHELGHILVARRFGIAVKKIGFNWTGMYTQRARGAGWPEVATCLAGAAVNLTLAVLFWDLAYWFALCNLIFALVNILPIDHSDGTHALEAMHAISAKENK